MPKGEENDRLDREELEGRVVRPQELLRGRVEEEESEEGNRDADVVNEGGVEVALCHLPLAFVVFAPSLKSAFQNFDPSNTASQVSSCDHK